MKYNLLLIISLMLTTSTFAQHGINDVLKQIEANNPTLKALQAQSENQKAKAKLDLLPPNPNIEGGRFPSVEGTGMKHAWGVSQHFEFPTVYARRNQLAKTTSSFADANYNAARQRILLDAKLALLDYIHAKRQHSELQKRVEFAQSMHALIKKKVDAGESTMLDLNNANLKLVEAKLKVREVEGNIRVINNKLVAMNGNSELPKIDIQHVILELPSNEKIKKEFFDNDYRFAALKQRIKIAERNKTLVTHQGLPELSIGYQSERTDAEHFSGFRAGLSIPLWGNRNKSKVAKIQLHAAHLDYESERVILESEFDELYLNAKNSYNDLVYLMESLNDYSNIPLLRKALEAGQVSVVEFFNEVAYLYSINDKVLELELAYAKKRAMLHRFEL
ncbi:MAG: TolC family protein [Bacteroidales bacterium]